MSISLAATGNVVLRVSREEADAIVDGLRMLLNARRYTFKEPHEDVRQLHASLYEIVERIEAEVANSAAPKGTADSGGDS